MTQLRAIFARTSTHLGGRVSSVGGPLHHCLEIICPLPMAMRLLASPDEHRQSYRPSRSVDTVVGDTGETTVG